MQVADDFFQQVMGLAQERITDREENYRFGDLRFPGGTVECKGQPIDPAKYPQNFVEVFEAPGNLQEYHLGGFEQVAEYLGADPAEFENVMVAERRSGYGGGEAQLGWFDHVSVSIASMVGSEYVVYVNSRAGHLYLYVSDDLIQLIADEVMAGGLMRGAGMSNDDTFAVKIPLSRMRWRRGDGIWAWTGDDGLEAAVSDVRTVLGG
ncbi:MAG: hypothetical protein U1E29_11880 [Coriobacteriia bacterium]|nr:hypothetical protein [Coriobacteriia bacterium]